MTRKSVPPSKSKPTYQEKGKRKMDESPSSKSHPLRRSRRRRTGGIFIQEHIDLETSTSSSSATPSPSVSPSPPPRREEHPLRRDSSPQRQAPPATTPRVKRVVSKPSSKSTKSSPKLSKPLPKVSPKSKVAKPTPKKVNSKPSKFEKGESSSNFRNSVDAAKFLSTFAHKQYTKGKTVDFEFFEKENFTFIKWLKDYGLEIFLSEASLIYDELVKLFYFHLEEDNGRYTSYLKGVEIAFTAEEFASIMHLPFVGELPEEYNVDMEDALLLLTGDWAISLKKCSFLSRDFNCVDFKLLHSIVSHCIYPRNGGHDAVSLDEAELMYNIIFGNAYLLVPSMLEYMLDQKRRKNGNLPFAMYLTRLFHHFKINLQGETPSHPSSYDVIKESTLKRMRYRKHASGEWKLSNEGTPDSAKKSVPNKDTEHQDMNVPTQTQKAHSHEDEFYDAATMPTTSVEDYLVGTDFQMHGEGHQVDKEDILVGGRDDDDVAQATPSHGFPDTPVHPHVQQTTPPVQASTILSPPSTGASQPSMQSAPAQAVTSPIPTSSSHTPLFGNTAQPSSVNVDFTSLQLFIESQFSAFSSRMNNIESNVSSLTHQFGEFRDQTNAHLNEMSNQLNTVTHAVNTAAPQIKETFSNIHQQIDFVTSTMLQEQLRFNGVMQDLRDNTDRICLTAGLPNLNVLLSEIAEQNKKRHFERRSGAYPFTAPPHFHRTKPFREKNTTAGQSSTSKPKTAHISSDDGDTSSSE